MWLPCKGLVDKQALVTNMLDDYRKRLVEMRVACKTENVADLETYQALRNGEPSEQRGSHPQQKV
jgi:hypothetical protein